MDDPPIRSHRSFPSPICPANLSFSEATHEDEPAERRRKATPSNGAAGKQRASKAGLERQEEIDLDDKLAIPVNEGTVDGTPDGSQTEAKTTEQQSNGLKGRVKIADTHEPDKMLRRGVDRAEEHGMTAAQDGEEDRDLSEDDEDPKRKCTQAAKKFLKILFFHLGPLALLAAYCAMCAAVMNFLESRHEKSLISERLDKLEHTVARIQTLTDTTGSNQTREALLELLKEFGQHVEVNGTVTQKLKWNYNAALFFTATVVSTIGYGHLTPVSFGGRIFCMAFALFGIPIMLLSVTRCGQGLAKIVYAFIEWISPKIKSNCLPNSLFCKTRDGKFRFPIYLALINLFIYIFLGAVLFQIWESWTLFESFYFCFITMTTIGFGDVVPEHQMFMLLSTFYIIIGLALTSMCIELAETEYVKRMRTIRRTFKRVEEKVGETVGKVGEKFERVGTTVFRESFGGTKLKTPERSIATPEESEAKEISQTDANNVV